MKIGPKYKIARRLGAPIFEKTQTQKFALSAEKKTNKRFQRPKSDYAIQLTEKQKARFFYGITEKQFKKYVKEILDKKYSSKDGVRVSPTASLLSSLESRLDNAIWRMGIARTHLAARQMVAHGHIMVNAQKTYSPSYKLNIGNVISIREGSKKSPLFQKEKEEKTQIPPWIEFDESKIQGIIKSKPTAVETELLFNLAKVIEFYQR